MQTGLLKYKLKKPSFLTKVQRQFSKGGTFQQMVLEQLSWMLQNELHPHIYTNFHFKWRLVRNVKTETKISKNTT